MYAALSLPAEHFNITWPIRSLQAIGFFDYEIPLIGTNSIWNEWEKFSVSTIESTFLQEYLTLLRDFLWENAFSMNNFH